MNSEKIALDTFKHHIEEMKFREQELRRLENEARTKRETVMHERMELEYFIDKTQQRLDQEAK
jgi:hypothetical protein